MASYSHSLTTTTLQTIKKLATPSFVNLPKSHTCLHSTSLGFVVRAVSVSSSSSVAHAQEEKKKQWKATIDFKWIRENKEEVFTNIKNRNADVDLELVLELCDKLLCLQKEVERLRGERNVVANKMKGKLGPSECQKYIEQGKNLKEVLATLEEDLVQLTDKLQQEAQCIPNLTHPDVPIGGEDCSALRKMVGSPREFSFPLKDHLQLGKELDLFDFDAASERVGCLALLSHLVIKQCENAQLPAKKDKVHTVKLYASRASIVHLFVLNGIMELKLSSCDFLAGFGNCL
ncbi:hypothetical protein IFM89_004093 [Coptis chinensis]|uniref:Serine-tRNA synthetase type1 N-terminal domain-containing protein n=1 Tax=Coptis chinensis TaxID=261450 RepID=A0A835IY60_9MAGN|nr:hypothetical protein IFM89_004093 [Coptis chinensis]